jgi:hypothetical protein
MCSEVAGQVNVPQDSLVPSSDNVYLCSVVQDIHDEENGASLNLANQKDDRVVSGDFHPTPVGAASPPFA